MKAVIKYVFIWFLLMIAGYIFFLGIYKVAVMSIPGFTINKSDPMLSSVLIMVCSQLLPMYVFWKRKYASYSFRFNYHYGENFSAKKLYLWAAAAAVGCFIFDVMLIEVFPFINDWNQAVFGDPEPYDDFGFIDLISGCLLAPLAEEAIFRGAIERRLLEKNWNPWYAIVISAVTFAACHFNLYALFSAFGILVGWVYYRTRCVWPGILIHVIFNTIAFLPLYISSLIFTEEMTEEAISLPLGTSIPLLLVGAAILCFSVTQIAAITRDRTPIALPDSEPESEEDEETPSL